MLVLLAHYLNFDLIFYGFTQTFTDLKVNLFLSTRWPDLLTQLLV